MLNKLIDLWKSYRLKHEIRTHKILGPVTEYIRAVLRDESQGLGKNMSPEGKQKLIVEIISDVDRVITDPNPKQAVRLRLIAAMLETAQYDVLIMKVPARFPGLSGELTQYLPQLASGDLPISKLLTGFTSAEDLWDATLFRYWISHLYLSSYNVVRKILHDYDNDGAQDWLMPCYTSMCIWQESQYRNALKLPIVIPGEQFGLRAIMHSSWMNRIEDGFVNLRAAWDKNWEEVFGEPSPYSGVDFYKDEN